jgi:hypothetical protein
MRQRIMIAAGAFVLVLVLFAAAALMIPAERVGGMVAARASAALDRDVSVERFRVKLLPRVAIALDGVEIGGPRAGADAPVAEADHGAAAASGSAAADTAASAAVPVFVVARRVELRPRILPLLQRRVVIDEVLFDGATVLVAVAADGTSNVPSMERGESEPGGDAELRIRRLRVTGGAVTYRDARDGTVVSLAGMEQTLRLSGDIEAGELALATLDGTLAIADIDATLPGRLAWPLEDIALRVQHSMELDRASDRLLLSRLEVALQEVALDVTGSITGLGDAAARVVDLRASTGSFDVARLVASLPRALLTGESGDVIEGAAGSASLDAVISGRAGGGAMPDVAGSLGLEKVALKRGRHGRIAEGLTGRIAFTADSAATDGIAGRLLGQPLVIVADVKDFAAPHGTIALRTALAMAEAQKLGLLPDGAQGSGRIAVDVRADGAFTEPAELLLNGSVDLAGVTLQLTSLRQPAVVEEGRIRLDGRNAAAQRLRARIGASDAELDFAADEWLPWALGDTTRLPVIAFDARAALFDADEIFGVDRDEHTYGELFFARLAGTTINGRSATEIAREIGLGLPDVPPLQLDGRIRANRLVNGGVAFDDVDVAVAARGGTLDVRAASFRMLGGGVQLTGRLGLGASANGDRGAQPLALDYTVNGVGTQQFLQRFTSFRDHIGGDMLLQGSVRMNLDEYLLPLPASVAGNGTIAILDGELVNWPLVRAIGERVGVARFDTLSFRDWTGRYTLAGARVVLEESMLEGRELSVRAAGSFDFGGGLDVGATLYVPPEWAGRIPGAPAAFLVNLVAGADGRVPVGARITGTATAPDIRLDMSEAGARAAGAAREAAQQQARETVTRVVDDVTDRLPLPPRDSLAATADTLRNRVESNIAERLRRVLRPGAAPAPAQPVDTATPPVTPPDTAGVAAF